MSKTTSSRTFKIRLELDTLNYTSPVLEIEAKDWEGVCEEIFGKLAIIDTEEEYNKKEYSTSPSTHLSGERTTNEELYCSKCGKTLKEGEYNDYEGMCATCWHERN